MTEDRVDGICSHRLILGSGAPRLAPGAGANFDDGQRVVRPLESPGKSTPLREVSEAHSMVHRATVEAS